MLGGCRKSLKMVILAISHVMKSMTYKHQIHRFRVFRQSLELSKKIEAIFISCLVVSDRSCSMFGTPIMEIGPYSGEGYGFLVILTSSNAE